MKNLEVAHSALPGNSDATAEDEFVARVTISVVFCLLLAVAAVVIVYLLPAAPAAPAAPTSLVRIRNDTSYPFQQVVINGQAYGNIDPGKETGYRELRNAYRYAQVRLVAAGHVLRLQPEDYVGEQPLGKGRFTYALTIVDLNSVGGLDIGVERDQR